MFAYIYLSCWVLQGIAVGENMVTLKYTTATAVKQKEGRLECKAEVLCEGKLKTTCFLSN